MYKTTEFIYRVRWRAYFYDFKHNGKKDSKRSKYEENPASNIFNLRTYRNTLPNPALDIFEKELMNVVKVVRPSRNTNSFQQKMSENIAQSK